MLFVDEKKHKTPIEKKDMIKIVDELGIDVYPNLQGISYTNDVYLVKIKGKPFYLKFFTDKWNDVNAGLQELSIMRLLEDTGRVARVERFGYANQIFPRNYALLTPIDGIPLCKLDDATACRVFDDCESFLAHIHRIRGKSGYYCHNPKVHSTFSTHREFLEDILDRGFNLLDSRGIPASDIKEMFRSHNEYLEDGDYVLCHNDFTPKHTLISEDKLMGVIDFEWSYFGHRESDYAQFIISLGINGFKDATSKALDFFRNKGNAKLLAYYSARQFVIAGVWTHRNVIHGYAQSCLDRARSILKSGVVEEKDVIWCDGSPVIENG